MKITEFLIAVAVIGVLVTPITQNVFGAERPEQVLQELERTGHNFIYNETTGRLHLLNSTEPVEERREAWVTPDLTGGGGYVIQDDYLTVVGEPRHSTSWYCFDGINRVVFEESKELYVCGE